MASEAQGAVLKYGSGDGTPDNIAGITLGAITKVESTGHANAVGDYGAFASIVGTTELNGQSAMVIAVETNYMYFDIDSEAYTAWDSAGTFTPVTFTEIGEFVDWDGPGGSASVIDVTHLQSAAKEKLIGLKDEGQLSITVNWDHSDTGQAAMQLARTNRTLTDFQLTFSDAVIATWSGYVLGFTISGAVDDKMSASITIEITGAVGFA